MEQRYQSLSIFEFQKMFATDEQCLDYLVLQKWGNGYECPKCKNTKYGNGTKPHDRQCTKCNYCESPTAGTLFHKVKFPLVKAFYITYFVSTNKKGIASTELSRKLNLRQKTCWLFKRKVMKAMVSSGNFLLSGKVEVDEMVVGGEEEGVRGRKNGKKKLVVIAIEKKKKGVSRFYAKVIPSASAENLGGFMRQTIEKEASIRTDKWTGYSPLKKDFGDLTQEKSGKKGENFPDIHRVIMNFKSWLRGIHHHVEDLQAYIDEYTYRFNRSSMKGNIFENLVKRMVEAKPCPYKMLIN